MPLAIRLVVKHLTDSPGFTSEPPPDARVSGSRVHPCEPPPPCGHAQACWSSREGRERGTYARSCQGSKWSQRHSKSPPTSHAINALMPLASAIYGCVPIHRAIQRVLWVRRSSDIDRRTHWLGTQMRVSLLCMLLVMCRREETPCTVLRAHSSSPAPGQTGKSRLPIVRAFRPLTPAV
jgi:hypothetical protein